MLLLPCTMFCLPFLISDFLLVLIVVVVVANLSSLPSSKFVANGESKQETRNSRQRTKHKSHMFTTVFLFKINIFN